MNYAAIYARSQEDFDAVTQELNSNGKVVLKRPTGDYYLLQGPLRMQETLITHCRVRIFAADHIEQGYVDFEVKNYQRFKEKYLSRSYFSIVDSGKEMIRLKDPKFAVRAYFPNGYF